MDYTQWENFSQKVGVHFVGWPVGVDVVRPDLIPADGKRKVHEACRTRSLDIVKA